jgi:hypothetical protein
MLKNNLIDTTSIYGAVDALPVVTLQIASQTNLEIVCDQLVRQHHYLGYQRLLGHRLKYLAFIEDRPIAALSFSAPALKLRVPLLIPPGSKGRVTVRRIGNLSVRLSAAVSLAKVMYITVVLRRYMSMR